VQLYTGGAKESVDGRTPGTPTLARRARMVDGMAPANARARGDGRSNGGSREAAEQGLRGLLAAVRA